MQSRRVCIVGGSGFVGRTIAAKLVNNGYHVSILTRRRERHRDLLVMPTVSVIEGNVFDADFLVSAFGDAGVVINLVGILNERGRSGAGFERAHIELSQRVVDACKQAGVNRLLHMSALNASINAPSHYLRSKAQAERLVLAAAADLNVTIFQPSVIFGPDDSFINRFADLLRMTPFVFPLACGNSRFQPVYVGDVAQAFVASIHNAQTYGKSYSLCGPRTYTLAGIVRYIVDQIDRRTYILPLGSVLSRLQAEVFEWLPPPLNKFKPFSVDNYHSLQVDSVCASGFPKLFGITPRSLESVVPCYLGGSMDAPHSCQRMSLRSD
ncbi:MAG: complex I NDUFA9 subunit family protein [Proteobacteria bacterium]|nr:complex I NDUFA9 subunit family protein [Pseudomonadota bacterium]